MNYPCDKSSLSDIVLIRFYRGVEQGLARWAHNPKVGGSNPPPAIFERMKDEG